MSKGWKITWIVLGVLVLGLFLIARMFVGGYNTLVNLHENTSSSWAQVENQLKRRSDLIPNLVNTVKGYASHEKEVFGQIAASRSKLSGAQTIPDKINAANAMGGALSRLLAIVERYPDLKANESFNRLQDELAGTENRLAVERRRYNETVKTYKIYAQKFPGRVYAALFGFSDVVYFQIEEKDKAVPEVKFD